MGHSRSRFVRTLISIGCVVFASSAHARQPESQQVFNVGLRGVYFVPNQGQWGDEEVHFGLKSRGLDVAFRESSLTMHLTRQSGSTSRPDASTSRACEEAVLDVERDAPLADTRGSSGESADIQRLTLTITFPGSNAALPIGGDPQEARFNYFVGGEGRGVATDVPSFGAIIYENLYDGIDLRVMGSDDGVLKYEFHCAPGTDYSQIRIAYDGIDSLCIDDEGNLQISTSFGTLADGAPLVWQEGSSSRADASTSRAREEAVLDVERDAPLADTRGSSDQTIPARFQLVDARTYRIVLDGPVCANSELVIDPDVEWMTYLGGGGDYDVGHDIAVDSAGNSLVAGYTNSTDFEGRQNEFRGGEYDAFVFKVSASGALRWMTFLGGSLGDIGDGIAVDSAGNALVAGQTTSTDFEGRNNANHGGHDAFLVKVSASGALQWMTYLGGSGRFDAGRGVAVDSAGNVLVTGDTGSPDFEGRNNAYHGGYDGFVVKVSASGALQWMTYLGGSTADDGNDIAVDSAGHALVTGDTGSPDFEGRNNGNHGSRDVFVGKVSASGALQWMTYLGGSDWEDGNGIALDGTGNSLVTGSVSSRDFEGRNNAHHGGEWDVFVVKLSASGALQWMTYLGGSDSEWGYGITVNSDGNSLVTGRVSSTDFEGRDNLSHGGHDACVVKLSASGALQSMTYLGGQDYDYGYGIAVNSAGDALVTGPTQSTDFEGRNNAHYGGWKDAFVVKVRIGDGLQLSVSATRPSGGPIQVSWSGATRAQLAALMFAVEQGAFVLPPQMPCAGTPLGLGHRQLQVVWTGNTGPDGSGSIGRFAGPNACGGYLQLLDVTTCTTSNVARIE